MHRAFTALLLPTGLIAVTALAADRAPTVPLLRQPLADMPDKAVTELHCCRLRSGFKPTFSSE